MDRAELGWRTIAAVRTLVDRGVAALVPPRWRRTMLAGALSDTPELRATRSALRERRWIDAHQALATHFAHSDRFLISGSRRRALVRKVRARFPDSASEAAARADRILAGEHDLLGYRRLRFDGWHHDPVHNAHAPTAFWSTVPFLDSVCGDHKVIWELNRHQHWLTLGRAFWLTGDRRYRDRLVLELEDWMHANPPLTGINWASMLELAFRSMSWIWALHFFAEPCSDDRQPWTVDLLLALDRQLTHVERNLSYYFSPNTHLLGEALALYVAGRVLPELAASRRREAIGRRILVAEISKQIADDGGHCERSTHYHRYTLDFYLFALAIARHTGDPIAADFERAATQLADAARLLADDGGRLPHFGDDDAGKLLPMTPRDVDDVRDSLDVAATLLDRPELPVGTPTEEHAWLIGDIRQSTNANSIRNPQSAIRNPSGALPSTGYYVSRVAGGHHLVVDGGPHGYQNCGHAHADALSLTLSVRGVPLLIDPGTGSYTADPALRDRLRSTALHNTVTLDERSQSRPRGPFHWSHVARTRVHRWETSDGVDYFDGAHDGYAPLAHRRRVLAIHGEAIIVSDFVDGHGTHDAAVHWHVDPRWDVTADGPRATLRIPGDRVDLVAAAGNVESFSGDEKTGLGWHSPVYGRVAPATTIRVSQRAAAPFWMTSAIDLQSTSPLAAIQPVPVWAEAGVLAHAAAYRMPREHFVDWVVFAAPSARGTWRVGELETDARVLFCRVDDDRRVSRVFMLDGTFARFAGSEIGNDVRNRRIRRVASRA